MRPCARSAVVAAVVCLALLVPARAEEAGAPLAVEMRPPAPSVLRADGRSSVLLELEILNTAGRKVRIREVAAVFLAGDRVLRERPFERAFFKNEVYPRAVRIPRGRKVEWRSVCLADVPEGADRLRLDFDLSGPGSANVDRVHAVEASLESAGEPAALALPFEGYWRVTQSHSCETNHRIGGYGGEFAWDFAALGPSGRSVASDYERSGSNDDSFSFGKEVLAPVGGKVVRTVDDVPDNEGLERYPRRSLLDTLERPEWVFGNFVVIDIGDGRFVLLGHLMRGSIDVEEGDDVAVGDVVGRCGNSGNTIEPHLHLQVMNRPGVGDDGVHGVPAVFVDYMEFAVAGAPESRDLLARRVRRGDPPEGRVIAPASPASE